MKNLGKLLGALLLGLFLLLIALGVAVTQFFDPNDYKAEIRQLARDRAGLELDLHGPLGWSLFPWLGLQIHDASLARSERPDQPFAEVDMLGLAVRVLPLLRREVEMSDIRIDGLRLDLQRDAQGRGNWEGLDRPAAAQPGAAAAPTGEHAASAPATEANSDSRAPALRLNIDSLALSNARIDYRDAAGNRRFSLEGIDLRSGAIREGAAIPLRISGFFASNQPLLRARAELLGQLRFDRALQRYQLEEARLQGDISGQPLANRTLSFDAQGDLLVDLAAQVAEWNALKLRANQLDALGELKLRELDRAPKFEGGLSLAEFDLRAFLEGIGQELPTMADPGTLRRAALVARLSGTADSLSLDDLKLQLDDSRIEGRLALDDFARQRLRAQLKGDRLDLDRYLAPPAKPDAAARSRQAQVADSLQRPGEGSTPLPEAPAEAVWSRAALLPLERLRSLDAELDLQFAHLTLRQLPLEDTRLRLRAAGGQLHLERLDGTLFDGRFAFAGSLDARGEQPLLQLRPELEGLPLERLLQAFKPEQPAPLRGNLQLQADLQARGNSEQALIDSLAGSASFALDNGVLPDANLEQQLCRGIALLNRKVPGSDFAARDTALRELSGSLQLQDGVARNRDLRARIPGLAANGQGDVDLRVLGLDYRLGVVIEGDAREMPDPACQVSARYVGLEWPLRCRGPLELGARACRLDQDGLGKIAARLAGEKLSEKLDEKLGDKVSPELKDALRGLFQR